MFESIRNFFAFLDVNPFWPALDFALIFIYCAIPPYRPVEKIRRTKDENGEDMYIVYRKKDK